MLFHYTLERSTHSVWPLGGRWVRPRPMIPVTVVGPLQAKPVDSLIDTGSDDTVFPELMAAFIGIDLSQAPRGRATGVGRIAYPVRYAEVRLLVTDGKEYRDWPARVGFTSAALRQSLLGFAGFLQFFTAICRGDREEAELTINSLYPGT